MKKTLSLFSIFLSLFVILIISSTASATIFASGDQTPAFYASSGDNDVLFANILEGGSSVVINDLNPYSSLPNNLNDYYNSLTGVSSLHYEDTTITTGLLSGVDLFVTGLNRGALDSSELSVLGSFVDAGGSVLFMGDYQDPVTYINDTLTYLGSSMSLIGPITDIGNWATTNIAVDPFTTGVSSFAYGATNEVLGGTSLFFDSQNRAFFAYEGTGSAPVPEPSTILLLGSGLAGLAFYRRKRK